MTGRLGSRFRRTWSRLVAEQQHAGQERERAVTLGRTPVAGLALRRPAVVCGSLRSVTLRPRSGVPALVAELSDGSGSVGLIWLGRRQITGIEPGCRIRVSGMVTEVDGRPAIYNPRYELVPRTHE